MKDFNIKPAHISDKLTRFISKAVKAKGFSKVILGLSGGLDSATVAYLSAKALGKENVIGVIMPYGRFSKRSVSDAKKVAEGLGIRAEYVDIAPMIDDYFRKAKDANNIRRGNKMARERMSILYDLSKKYNALVIGTSNRTELLLGYGTIYGDTACALNPIGGLYKSQLKTLAKHLGVPSFIINKKPTAGLWQGQTDEGELGHSYRDMDKLLFLMIDKKSTKEKLLKKSFSKKFILDIQKRMRDNIFKSRLPIIAKIERE